MTKPKRVSVYTHRTESKDFELDRSYVVKFNNDSIDSILSLFKSYLKKGFEEYFEFSIDSKQTNLFEFEKVIKDNVASIRRADFITIVIAYRTGHNEEHFDKSACLTNSSKAMRISVATQVRSLQTGVVGAPEYLKDVYIH